MKYGELNLGQIEAIVNKLGGMGGVHQFLSGELLVSTPFRSWREEDGVIYFSVTSDSTTGEDWIKRLKSNGFRVGDYAKQVLRSPDFKPTNGVTTDVAVLKGMLFEDNDRITKKIRAEADKRKLGMPEPINDSDGDPFLLYADRDGVGRWLDACRGGPDDRWYRVNGFAFAVSQVSSQH